LKPFFTISDPFLSKETSVDPMGIQKIWTRMAHEVFSDKLTTIANDIRIFSINLFHHYFIWKYYKEFHHLTKDKYTRLKSDKYDLKDLKLGILIFLEDLTTLSFVLNKNNFDGSSIPGSLRANGKLSAGDFTLAAFKESGFLKNQINLGMAGRYKGPLVSMKILDRHLNYNPTLMPQLEEQIVQWKETELLENHLHHFVTKLLFASENKGYPTLDFYQFKDKKAWTNLVNSYMECFGKRTIPRSFKKYFKSQLGLNDGGSAVVYDLIDIENISSTPVIFRTAVKTCKDPIELNKLQRIVDWAPILSHAEQVLRHMSNPDSKSLDSVQKELEILRDAINKSQPPLNNILIDRQREVLNVVCNDLDYINWVKGIVEYHKKIMNDRGGEAWLSITDKNGIKHNFSNRYDFKTAKEYLSSGEWHHSYYIPTLKNFKTALG
jgi:hypothetical protein